MKRTPREVSPRKVLAEIAAAIPAEVHPNIIIIGSLAAGYWLFRGDDSFGVRTKDVDCVLSPHLSAVEKGRAVAQALISRVMARRKHERLDGHRAPRVTLRFLERPPHPSIDCPPSASIHQAVGNGLSSFSPNRATWTRA